jgi:hypothetical protein
MGDRPTPVTKCFVATGCLLLICTQSALCAELSAGDELRLKAQEVFEHTTEFMVGLDLALIGAVGFFAKDGFVKPWLPRAMQQVSLLIFLAVAWVSLFFAYQSHMELMQQLAGGVFDYPSLSAYVWQAISLIAASAFSMGVIGPAIWK